MSEWIRRYYYTDESGDVCTVRDKSTTNLGDTETYAILQDGFLRVYEGGGSPNYRAYPTRCIIYYLEWYE